MAAKYGFHPESLLEYAEAAEYYLYKATPPVAEGFIEVIESAIADVVANPTRWAVVDEPEIRRYVIKRYPYIVYYRWESQTDSVTIYAVMHCSREPGYWRHRLPGSTAPE